MTTACLPERLTMVEARATLERLVPQMQSGEVSEIDASPLEELDSAAVAVLLACLREAHSRGRIVHIAGMPEKLLQIARLYGVDDLLKS